MDERVSALLEVGNKLHVERQDTDLRIVPVAYFRVGRSLLRRAHSNRICLPDLEHQRSDFDHTDIESELSAQDIEELE